MTDNNEQGNGETKSPEKERRCTVCGSPLEKQYDLKSKGLVWGCPKCRVWGETVKE